MFKGNIVTLRELRLKDVYTFKNWSKHTSQLFLDYNFYEIEKEDIEKWYTWKTSSPFSIYYVILKEEKPVGYISFKNISNIFKCASLGIVLNPACMDRGYGTDALKTMLKYYFNDLNFKRINLKVASYNKWAINLYSKIGFVKKRTTLMPFPNGDFDINNEDFSGNKDCFKKFFGKTFFYAFNMDITREDFENEV